MNILFVLENYLPHIGGVETVFKNLTGGLVKRGHSVDLVTHRIKGTKRFEVINGVRVHRVGCFGSRYLFTFFSIPKVLKLARKADLIHTTTFNGAPPAWLASKLTGKKCLITVHEVWIKLWNELGDMNFFGKIFHDFLERLIYSLPFDFYVCVSNSTQKQLQGIGKGLRNSAVIHNGVDYNHLNPKKYDGSKIRKRYKLNKKFVYMFFGRPGISKGVEYLIRAVPLIKQKIPNSKLLMILSRDKAYRKQFHNIIKLIKKLKIMEDIILLEPQPYKELPSFIKASDCVVVPSLAEGFGYTVIEALEMQKPVVASNTTSIPEVIYGDYVLVRPKSPDGIAAGIEMVKNKRTMHEKKKTFTIEKNIRSYTRIYSYLMNK